MQEAIGGVLAFGVGVALSPLPIVAVILMLLSRRARGNAFAFVLGWLVGLTVVGVIVLAIAGPTDASEDGSPATWVSILKLVIGILLVLIAVRRWRRPHDGRDPQLPAWMGAIEQMTPIKSLVAGALLSGVNPKNLLLAVGAASAIAQTGISGGQQALAYAIFVVIGTVGVATPIVIYLALGARAADLLQRLKAWMGTHNSAVMSVLCLVIGAKLIGDAIGTL